MSVKQSGSLRATDYDLPGSDEQAPDGIDVKNVIDILSRRKLWIVGVTSFFCALAIIYVVFTPPIYTATAQVYVDPRDRTTPKEEPLQQNSVPGDGLLLVESQLKIITSEEVLARVVDKMGLRDDPDFNGRNSLLSALMALIGLAPSDPPELIALRNLRLSTTAKRNDRSFVIDIMVSAKSRAQATDLANAVTNAYMEEQAKANANFNRRVSEAITSQLNGMQDAVSRSEQAVAAYKAAHDLVGSRNRLVTEEELDDTNTQLTAAKIRLSEAQARVRLIDSILAGGAQLDALPEAIQSGVIVQLRARAADLSRDATQMALIYGPNHPSLRQAQAQLKDVQAAITAEVRRIAQAVRNMATSARTNVQTLQARFDKLKALSKANEAVIVPLRELERKAETNRGVYETFLAKAKTASEQQVIDTTNIRMISRASPPERKSWPPTTIMLAAALFGGLAFGIATALARESLGRRGAARPRTGGRRFHRSVSSRPSVAAPPR